MCVRDTTSGLRSSTFIHHYKIGEIVCVCAVNVGRKMNKVSNDAYTFHKNLLENDEIDAL